MSIHTTYASLHRASEMMASLHRASEMMAFVQVSWDHFVFARLREQQSNHC